MTTFTLRVPEDMKDPSNKDTYTPGRNALHSRGVEKSVVYGKQTRVIGRRERARLNKRLSSKNQT
jgi:hypothetical protein